MWYYPTWDYKNMAYTSSLHQSKRDGNPDGTNSNDIDPKWKYDKQQEWQNPEK